MPTKNFRAFYRGLDDAVEGLYHDELLTLADDGKTPDFGFDSRIFERAAEWVRERGGFTPSMLQEQPARDVIDETFRILGGAVSSSISEEMPAELTGLLENNAFIFSGLKTYHSLNEVGLSLIGDDGGIKPFEKFHEDVAKIDAKYNRNYLYAEYNHAVTSSQMAAKWHDFQQDGDRYNLQYRTANDERVREEHQRLHNITLPVSDPFWEQFMPPNGWNCRCVVVQVRKGRYPESDSQQAVGIGEQITEEPKKRIFRFNPGKELKVFPDKHPYNKAPQKAKEQILQLAKERFSAKTIEEAEQQFRDVLGINCRLDGFKKKDIAQVKDIFDCVERHFRDFPELKSKIKFVGSMTGRVNLLAEAKYKELKPLYPNALDSAVRDAAKKWARKVAYLKDCYAYSSEGCEQYGANGLVFNTAWAGDKIVESLKRDVQYKFHPIACDTVKAVFDHELGHKIDALLGLRKDAEFLKIFREAVVHGEQYIIDNLSHYAYDSRRMRKPNYTPEAEFIAEAWSEYLNNPQAREIATAVGKLIEKKCGELKR
ncbi:phage minor head protein [uncultured Alistipes sp.]|uniref:phage minor head protein n=1 Tax=uncultured Alistipes sp. TaxID=538949 RepID=UPI00272C1756|nr:phage minor head protein [uncultured Alistipes sp.]